MSYTIFWHGEQCAVIILACFSCNGTRRSWKWQRPRFLTASLKMNCVGHILEELCRAHSSRGSTRTARVCLGTVFLQLRSNKKLSNGDKMRLSCELYYFWFVINSKWWLRVILIVQWHTEVSDVTASTLSRSISQNIFRCEHSSRETTLRLLTSAHSFRNRPYTKPCSMSLLHAHKIYLSLNV